MTKRKLIHKFVGRLSALGFFNFLSDKKYIKLVYWARMGKHLDLNNPQTFNEKLQWLKLHNRNPEYSLMVDKYEAKRYVAKCIGDKYIIPTIGVWERFEDIDFDKLPDKFVLKCTHDSGGLVICRDKSKLVLDEAKKKIERSLKTNYFLHSREWPYKNVKPRIIAEQYMEDESGYELKDYKVFNFDGQPYIIQVDFDRFKGHKKNLYTTEWEFIEKSVNYPNDPEHVIDKPKALSEMLELARKLAKNIPFVRTDFYSIDDKVYFGEITFYPGSGFMSFNPDEFDEELGKLIPLN